MRRVCWSRTKPSSWRCVATVCCRWTTAFTPFGQRSRSCPRSSLQCCLHRHGIGRLCDGEGDAPEEKAVKRHPIGYFPVAIAEVRTAEAKANSLSGAIDRGSKCAFVRGVARPAGPRLPPSSFHLIEAVADTIHAGLTDTGTHVTSPPRHADRPTARSMTHMCGMRCGKTGLEHRPTKARHAWTSGQGERMNRTIKDAAVKRVHRDGRARLEADLDTVIGACTHGRRLRTPRRLTPP